MAVSLVPHLSDTPQSLDLALRRAKFTIPQRQRTFIDRERLVSKLLAAMQTDGTRTAITAITAPVGTGKTTLAAAAARAGAPFATSWCTLDDGDNDPHEFGVSILEAVLASRACGSAWRVGDARQVAPDPLDEALLVIAHGGPHALVLDECETLLVEARNATIGRLLRHAPSNLSLVLLSNDDVPLTTRGVMPVASLRHTDLAFNEAEITELFAMRKCAVARDTVQLIRERTEGYATAVALAAAVHRDVCDGDPILASAISADTTAHVELFERVLQRLTPDQYELLVSTSIVEVISADLAEALVGTPGGGAVFAELVRTDLFFDAVGECPGWFRHRHPSRELLSAKLGHGVDVARLQEAAALWFAAAGQDGRALESALRAGAWDIIVELVRRRWIAATFDELDVGLDTLPQIEDAHAARSIDAALVACVVAIEHGDQTRAREMLDAVSTAHAPASRSQETQLFHALLSVRLARDACDPHELRNACVALFDWCEANSASRWLIDARMHVKRCAAEASLLEADIERAVELLEQVCTEGVIEGREPQVANATAALAVVTALSGRVRRAAALVAELGDGWFSGATFSHGVRCVASAICEYHFDDLPSAQIAASEARTQLRPSVYQDTILTVVRARIARSIGDKAGANRLLNRATAFGNSALVALVSDGLGMSAPERSSFRTSPAQRTRPPHPHVVAREALLAAARAYDAGEFEAAADSLEHALAFAERNAYRRILVDSPVDVRALLLDYIGHARPFSQIAWQLLQRLPEDRPESSMPVVETLTERELAVLWHLPMMKSNREIAADMSFSVNTVKTHLKSIYRKLGVNRRRAAVEEARYRSII